ncbi:MAG: hypothetical protein DRH30_07535 [Deltaproteobacteria bacterium]|nr:MAG: hypothetical protein DRH30_07535 [Deltaproteobacteria bacterium]
MLDAFENPTAAVTGPIMEAVADEIAQIRDDIEDSDFFDEILKVIADVQAEIDAATDEDGNLDIGGEVTFPTPNGGVSIEFICEGWDDPSPTVPDPANGTIQLTMRLVGGTIGPLIWGIVDECRFPVEIGPLRSEDSYDGKIAVHLGEFVSPSQNLHELPITFISDGTIGIDGRDVRIKQSFRVTFKLDDEGNADLDGLAILVELDETQSFVYFFEGDLTQGIRDASGTFACNLEERRCTGFSW